MNRYDDTTPHALFRSRMAKGSGFINYGISLDGEKPRDLVEGNMNMVDWIIEKLQINESSYILEVGCGKGGYVLNIVEKTGCKFVGLDLLETFIDLAKRSQKDKNLEKQGEFHVGTYQDFPDIVDKTINFTHILAIGSFYYIHPEVDLVLANMEKVCNANTKILIWDFLRVKDWSECGNYNQHMKLDHPLLSVEEMKEAVGRSNLTEVELVDLTDKVIPCLEYLKEESLKDDPKMEYLTYPLIYKGFVDGQVKYTSFILRKENLSNS